MSQQRVSIGDKICLLFLAILSQSFNYNTQISQTLVNIISLLQSNPSSSSFRLPFRTSQIHNVKFRINHLTTPRLLVKYSKHCMRSRTVLIHSMSTDHSNLFTLNKQPLHLLVGLTKHWRNTINKNGHSRLLHLDLPFLGIHQIS